MKKHYEIELNEQVKKFMHSNFFTFNENDSIENTINDIRKIKDDGRIMYFYTVDNHKRLTGVIPVRKLLTNDLKKKLKEIAKKDLITVQSNTDLYNVAKIFESYKYLSLPVVDEMYKVVGVIDLQVFIKKDLDISNKYVLEEAFQTIGIRVSKIVNASMIKSYQFRIPWLLSTLTAGIICALLAGVYQMTLSKSIILSFFLALVLALGESTSIQSMSIVLQKLHTAKFNFIEYIKAIFKEIRVGFLIGITCGGIIFLIAFFWKKILNISIAIGFSIFLSTIFACIIGLTIPIILFTLKINPKISSGPIVLALTDISTIVIYFTTGNILLF